MWTLAQYELSHCWSCMWSYTGIAAYLWKKTQKSSANEPHLNISTEFTWKKNSLMSLCLMKHWILHVKGEHMEQASGTATLEECCVCRSSPNANVFKEKSGGRTRILETKFGIKGRKGKENVLAFTGKSVAGLRVCTHGVQMGSWAPWGFLETPAQEHAP